MSKQFILYITLLLLLCACSKTKYEYKIVRVTDEYEILGLSPSDTRLSANFGDQTELLNRMSDEGWELDEVYTETSTSYPNFGEPKYHTGIKSNVHTSALNFIFKREKNSGKAAKTQEEKQAERNAELIKAIREGRANKISIDENGNAVDADGKIIEASPAAE